ncbi:divalent-cation tolerance protein CutA [bacterium]|nr:divalent-cation tolerance protein CutA [bacterium]
MNQTDQKDGILLVQITVPDRETADSIAHALVEKRLAACVNILPGLTSVYRWKGETCKDAELLLLIKTIRSCFDSLKDVVIDLHPYDLPEIIGTDVSHGLDGYLKWVRDEIQIIS